MLDRSHIYRLDSSKLPALPIQQEIIENRPDEIEIDFHFLAEYPSQQIYSQANVLVYSNEELNIAIKQAPYLELLAQHWALRLLREDGFSPPASRIIKESSKENGDSLSFLIMDLIPTQSIRDGRAARFHERLNPIHREYEKGARELLEKNGFDADVWVHEEFGSNVALKQGLLQRVRQNESIIADISKADFIPFDPVCGFRRR